MPGRVLPALAALLVAATPVAAAAAESTPRAWIDGDRAGRPFLDLAKVPAQAIPAGQAVSVPLDPPFRFRGALYDTLLVGGEPGTARLGWTGTVEDGRPSPAPRGPFLRLQPLGTDLQFGFAGGVQLRRAAGAVGLRWTGLEDAFGEPAGFDLLLDPTGQVLYQYLQVPPRLRSFPKQAGVVLADEGNGLGRVEPTADGYRPRSGGIVIFPGDLPWDPMTGCGIAPNWCSVVQAQDQGCITASGHNDETTCATTQAKRWHFNEGQYCRSCPYTFYVTVECGTEMHLPFRDMEGNQIQITDVFTGVQLELEALNDCAKQRFVYCNRCPNNTIIPAPAAGCGTTPTLDCLPYIQHSTLIQWGFPFQDLDGDTVMDDLPCGPPNTRGCGGSGSYPAFEEQNTDVILHGSPALCGVFRLDILSGGFHWFLSANCTGIVPDDPAEIARNFNVYQNCADALAAFDPLPELVITRLDFSGACPNIQLNLEVTNLGCADTASSPIHVSFSTPAPAPFDVDLGPVAAGTKVATSIPLTLTTTPVTATAAVDPANIIAECTEQAAGSFSGCQPTTGSDSLSHQLCVCSNNVQMGLAQNYVYSCNLAPAIVDASPSVAVPCAAGMEWRFLDDAGGLLQDWSTVPTYSVVPPYCPSVQTVLVEARCASEPGALCVGHAAVDVECVETPTITVQARPTEVCWGQATSLTASAGLVTYTWDDGQTGRVITVNPVQTTNYTVSGLDPYGCPSSGQVTVTVDPDPRPGPIGNTLRCRKAGTDVVFWYQELPITVGSYELLCDAPLGTQPCGVFLPPGNPDPTTMQGSISVATAPPGALQPALRHVDGVITCPRLLFYNIVGTSPCTHQRGPACDGWPHQIPPCPTLP